MAVLPAWRGLCQQSGIAPLKLVPFLPQDNKTDDQNMSDDSSTGEVGNSNTRASQATLARANTELGRCLALPFLTFLSFVLEDESLGKFVDTFLRWVSGGGGGGLSGSRLRLCANREELRECIVQYHRQL